MMNSEPHTTRIAKCESSMMRTVLRKLAGQLVGAPSAVLCQSNARISAPDSPPPESHSSCEVVTTPELTKLTLNQNETRTSGPFAHLSHCETGQDGEKLSGFDGFCDVHVEA